LRRDDPVWPGVRHQGDQAITVAGFPRAQVAPIALLGVVVALAVWLRLRHAAASMAFDEMATMYFSGQSWRHLWGWWMLRETNPPLFYSLVKVWRMVVPVGHWSMRALPLGIAFATFAVFGRFARARLGWSAALLGLLLFAVSASDIAQSDYLRGYGLAKLAVLVSFIGLVAALDGSHARRGWLVYLGGAVVAIYCHTTMVLWPVIATLAVLGDAAVRRDWPWRALAALLIADGIAALLSGWVLIMAWAQLESRSAANITWLEPLGWADFATTCNLQLLTGGLIGSGLMALAMAVGLWRGRHLRVVRLSAGVVIATLVLFKATDRVHPIVSDFTLHWCFSFTVLIAAAALLGQDGGIGQGGRAQHRAIAGQIPVAVLVAVTAAGLIDLWVIDYTFVPQDWRQTVRTAAARRDTALLASHESIGVVIEQSCLIEFGTSHCPFALIVMADPHQTDNWAFGGYHGRLVAAGAVRAALGRAMRVYAFSRYYYTPLEHLGLRPRDWPQIYWDDGELIGPIPTRAFDPPAPYPPEPDAQYTGAPDPA
jgi:uncharacterized membrane protein